LHNELGGAVILPIGELNRLRRELVFALEADRESIRPESQTSWRELLRKGDRITESAECDESQLTVLCRTIEQIEASLDCGVEEIYVDFEDLRRYRDAVALVRERAPGARIFLATPRIQKAGEQGFFKLIENARPDGVLVRNLGSIDYFRSSPSADEKGRANLQLIGDFSLNVANPLAAELFLAKGLERIAISYDLNFEQVIDLLQAMPPDRFELTLHQHIPMFHMEHCVFAAFLSKGKSFLDCGRPCDQHRVHLRDRVGMEHPLRADVGCRNTLFNAVAQTGARYFMALREAGLRWYRVELLEESRAESVRILRAYQDLLAGRRDGEDLWRDLAASSQLGVTRGTLG
jgi:putative protease